MKHVAIVGAGPAGLMAAEVISAAGHRVAVYDRMPSAGRKFLMAGRGGLNLTHSEELARFLARYRDRAPHLRAAIEALPPEALRAWCEELGQPTFVGSSGRVFPKSMKTSPLLRAWLKRLGERGVELHTRHRWTGWDDSGRLTFETPEGLRTIEADAVLLALGGASWPSLGSDGGWVKPISDHGIAVAPLEPANCGFQVAWSRIFLDRFEGQPLKRIAIHMGNETARGELMCTAMGLEGGAIYALSAPIRDALHRDGSATITIDLKPDASLDELARAVDVPRRKLSMSSYLQRTAKLSPVDIGLLQEAAHANGEPLAGLTSRELAAAIKSVPVKLVGIAPIDRAISTAGGITFDEIDDNYMLRRQPGTFVAGEMLDWEAPTGGYLLQACFSTGAAAARGVIEWLRRE